MRLTRVFVDAPLASGTRLTLPDAAAGHLLRVLRLGVGDACILFNGDSHDYHASIAAAGKRDASVEITRAEPVNNESPLRIILLQAIARGEKMDWIVQKATELGVARIVPVLSERSEVRLDGDRVNRRLEHWRGVTIAACEQSGRARVPAIDPPVALVAALPALPPASVRLALVPDGNVLASNIDIATGKTVVIAVGPEGGWSPDDLRLFGNASFDPMRLGPRILRTETAGIAAIAALQALHGDMT